MTTTRKPEPTAKCDECWNVVDTWTVYPAGEQGPGVVKLCVHCRNEAERSEW